MRFNVDSNGILFCDAIDLSCGIKIIVSQNKGRLSRNQIETMEIGNEEMFKIGSMFAEQ